MRPATLVSCNRHPNEKLQFWCNTCLILICSNCMKLQHQGHVCIDIDSEASNKAKEQQDGFTKVKSTLDQLIKHAMDLMMMNENPTMEQITKCFDSIRSVITKHEKELKRKVRSIEKRNKSVVENFQNKLRMKQEKLNEKNKEFDDILSAKDHTKLLQEHEKSINYLKNTAHELTELKCPIRTKYRIDEIDQLQQMVLDILQRVCVHQWKADITIVTGMNPSLHSNKFEKYNFAPLMCDTMEDKAPSVRGANANDISSNVKWTRNRFTVAGGNGQGNKTNQLSGPSGLYVDDNETIYVADFNNNRIIKWEHGAKRGIVVAGGNGKGNGANQLNRPYDVIVDKNSDSLIISDNGNLRVVRWSRRKGTTFGETLISNIACTGLTMDENGFLYVVDENKHEVRRYQIGDTKGTLVAGGNGKGDRLDQLCEPWYIFLDENHSAYVSDWGNHRVMKWDKDAKQGIVVAGGHGKGNSLRHLSSPEGVVVDRLGTVYVSDSWNDRIVRWSKGAAQGSVIIGRHRISCPIGLSFDRHNNLYVVDWGNHRVQRFSHQ